MNKKTIWIVLILLIIGGIVFFFVRRPREEEDVDTKEVAEEQEQEENGESERDTEYEYTGDTDFSSFSTDEQVVGEVSDNSFSIEGVEESRGDGYHKFTFTLRQEEVDEELKLGDIGPFVIATYLSNIGSIRMDFQNVLADNTGIGYQQERRVDRDGVLRTYHNISAQSDQEIYDIGISRITPFELTSVNIEEDLWEVMLRVKYPGDVDIDIDLGSEEFSREDQSIEGVASDDNASITAYTYGRPAGLLKLTWTVGSDADNPIPNVTASFNEDNDLVVVFEDLVLDRVVGSITENMSLPSGITVTAEREGNRSTYTFSNISIESEYRLSASLSPNQVSLEIR
jgi:hypothetical protein